MHFVSFFDGLDNDDTMDDEIYCTNYSDAFDDDDDDDVTLSINCCLIVKTESKSTATFEK